MRRLPARRRKAGVMGPVLGMKPLAVLCAKSRELRGNHFRRVTLSVRRHVRESPFNHRPALRSRLEPDERGRSRRKKNLCTAAPQIDRWVRPQIDSPALENVCCPWRSVREGTCRTGPGSEDDRRHLSPRKIAATSGVKCAGCPGFSA
jgi:hypothetical protein